MTNEFHVTLPSELLTLSVHVYHMGTDWNLKQKHQSVKQLNLPTPYLLDGDLLFTRDKIDLAGLADSRTPVRLEYKGKTSISSIGDKIVSMGLGRVEAEVQRSSGGRVRVRQGEMAVDVDEVEKDLVVRGSVSKKYVEGTRLSEVVEEISRKFVIETRHTGRVMKYTIVKKIERKAGEYEFEYEGKKMTLMEYYKMENKPWKQWSKTLENPEFPCLLVDKRGRVFPPELCFLHKDTYFHSHTVSSAKQDLSNVFACRRLLESLSVSAYLKPFGASIQTKPRVSQGKILAEAVLQYRGMTTMVANGGSWVLTGQKLLETPSVTVAVGVMSFLEEAVEPELVKTLAEEAKKYGLILNEQISVCTRISMQASFDNIRSIAVDVARKLGPTGITFVFLPRRDERIYQMVKASELFSGVPTQVLDVAQGERKPQYLHSLVLQLNAKIPTFSNSATLRRSGSSAGIALPELALTRRKLLVLGIRRTQDRLFITASVDKFHSIFICQIVKNANVLTALKRIVDRFELMNHERPHHVLVLSEAPRPNEAVEQLKELKAAKAVFTSSLISFASVRRPSIARYFCEKPNEADKKTGHVPVGASLFRPQGWSAVFPISTARPLEFSLLEDQIGTAEDLDKFLFALCHLGGIATKSTAWPGVLAAAQKLERRWQLYVEQFGEATAEKLVNEDAFQQKLQGLAFFS